MPGTALDLGEKEVFTSCFPRVFLGSLPVVRHKADSKQMCGI